MTNKLNRIAMVLIACVAGGEARAEIGIVVREHAVPHGAVIRLADVAEVTGADSERGRQLAGLPLMPAPAPGTERYLRKREIQDMLAAQGVDLGGLRFSGADQVAVATSDPGIGRMTNKLRRDPLTNEHAVVLAGGVAQRSVATKADKAAGGVLDEARIAEIRQQLSAAIGKYINTRTGKVAAWKIDCDLEERDLTKLSAARSSVVCSGGSDPWVGRQRILLSFATADGPVQLSIFAEVSLPPMPVVIATRPLAKGDIVKAADIEVKTIDASAKSGGQRVAFDSVQNLIGMEARQPIQPGDVVYSDLVQPPVLVKRGDIITVTSQSGGIRVRTSGRALQDGANGDLVQVESLGSRQKYDARIVGPREATVFAYSRPAAPPTEPSKRIDTARRQLPQ